jgi:two-component system response regulator (stage 0 sporulation protein F)
MADVNYSNYKMKNNKILIIDNNEGVQFAFRTMMQKEGFEGVKAPNGHTALDILNKDDLGGIFLELNLPDMDGLKLLESIREIDSRIPVVILTGMGSPSAVQRAAELGIMEFVEKPVPLAKMREILKKIKTANYKIKPKYNSARRDTGTIIPGNRDSGDMESIKLKRRKNVDKTAN